MGLDIKHILTRVVDLERKTGYVLYFLTSRTELLWLALLVAHCFTVPREPIESLHDTDPSVARFKALLLYSAVSFPGVP
jgi:hypothetical protein